MQEYLEHTRNIARRIAKTLCSCANPASIALLFIMLLLWKCLLLSPSPGQTGSRVVYDDNSGGLDKVKSYSSVQFPLVLIVCRDSGEIANANRKDNRFGWNRQKEQFRTLIGTLLLFSKLKTIKVLLFIDAIETYVELLSTLSQWSEEQKSRIIFEMHEIDSEMFRNQFFKQWRPCAWTKMFLDLMLPEQDSVVYADSDMLFLGPFEDTFKIFPKMVDPQSIATGPEYWYMQENRTQYIAGKYGINTGTMVLNLTRIRKHVSKGLGHTLASYDNLDPKPRHDQDVLNAHLRKHPELLYQISTRYNFLPSACLKFGPLCNDCYNDGILFLHGADSTFYRLVDAKSRVSGGMTRTLLIVAARSH